MNKNYQPIYINSRALVIGINNYKFARNLEHAVNDAQAISEILTAKFSFPKENIIFLSDENATCDRILKAFFTFTKGDINNDDKILIYFAGHGHTHTGNRGEVGYLVPQDGDIDDLSTLIRWDDLTKNAEVIPAKHLFFIMDACYGGLALKRSSLSNTRFLKDMLIRYSRQVLTAGKANEEVSDAGGPLQGHSIFTGNLIQALNGAATGESGLLTANGVMSYIYDRVSTDYASIQTPHYSHLDGDGDFIFLTPENDFLKEEQCNDSTNNKKVEYRKSKNKKNEIKIVYQDTEKIKNIINSNFDYYFDTVFGLQPGKESQKNTSEIEATLNKVINKWKQEIIEYRDKLRKVFTKDNLQVYEELLDDFKNKIFSENLWTVNAALKSFEPDLARYKKDFSNVLAEDILSTLTEILQEADSYVNTVAGSLDYKNIIKIEDLKLAFLDEEEMFLNKIIGFGIRSEILHRIYPAHFPIMTQRSLWGMYFLTNNADEFITIEQKIRKGKMRVSHNWQYNYERFTYYNNYLVNTMIEKVKNLSTTLKPEIRFGYINMFLVGIAEKHKNEIRELKEWSKSLDE